MLRPRAVRSQIYLPVIVFGVASSDWKCALAAGLLSYTIPYLLDLKLWKIPLELITTVLVIVLTIVGDCERSNSRRSFVDQELIRNKSARMCALYAVA